MWGRGTRELEYKSEGFKEMSMLGNSRDENAVV